jgi:hypothetical protein
MPDVPPKNPCALTGVQDRKTQAKARYSAVERIEHLAKYEGFGKGIAASVQLKPAGVRIA